MQMCAEMAGMDGEEENGISQGDYCQNRVIEKIDLAQKHGLFGTDLAERIGGWTLPRGLARPSGIQPKSNQQQPRVAVESADRKSVSPQKYGGLVGIPVV